MLRHSRKKRLCILLPRVFPVSQRSLSLNARFHFPPLSCSVTGHGCRCVRAHERRGLDFVKSPEPSRRSCGPNLFGLGTGKVVHQYLYMNLRARLPHRSFPVYPHHPAAVLLLYLRHTCRGDTSRQHHRLFEHGLNLRARDRLQYGPSRFRLPASIREEGRRAAGWHQVLAQRPP
jgi:hypothetical protein